MEGVRESLSSAQHDPEFASVRVVTSKTPGRQMWAEYQAMKEIILRDCELVCVRVGVEHQRGED